MLKRALVLTLAAAMAAGAGHAQAPPAPKATIDTGVLAGATSGGVNSFKAIPFALPPLGVLRWAPPERPSRWRGQRDATRFALPCAQPVNADGKPNGGGVAGATGEDCLYLNVWAPTKAKNAPVMLWLYGGAGYLGGANLGGYDGTAFARDGVIVITANYRLGAMGAFAHPALTRAAKPDEPLGSYALMDAVAALQWAQRNVAAFGGDPRNVTLFGQSAGGGMVLSLLSVPAARGLYQKAIIESGAALRPGLSLSDAEAAGVKAATALGLPGAAATPDQLRAVPVEKFVENAATRSGTGAPIDGRFRTTSTAEALKAGTAYDVPLIVGTNTGEPGAEGARAVVALAAGGAPAWLYQFAYVPDWRKAEQPNGAPHSAEIPYVFASQATSATGGGEKVTDKDRAVAARVHSCWAAFAKAPVNAKAIKCAGNFTWPAYTAAQDSIAVFGETPSVRKAAGLPAYAAPAPARTAAQSAPAAPGPAARASFPTPGVPASTEAGDAVARRRATMRGFGAAVAGVRAPASAGDFTAALAKARDLDASVHALAGQFPANSGPANGVATRAKGEIWSDAAGFKAAMDRLTSAADAIAGAANARNADQVNAAVTAFQATCAGCHTAYRAAAAAN